MAEMDIKLEYIYIFISNYSNPENQTYLKFVFSDEYCFGMFSRGVLQRGCDCRSAGGGGYGLVVPKIAHTGATTGCVCAPDAAAWQVECASRWVRGLRRGQALCVVNESCCASWLTADR